LIEVYVIKLFLNYFTAVDIAVYFQFNKIKTITYVFWQFNYLIGSAFAQPSCATTNIAQEPNTQTHPAFLR